MPKIELLLGPPTTTERESEVEVWVDDYDVCLEMAVIMKVKTLINSLSKKNKDDETYFDLVATIALDKPVKLPKISFEVYRHKGFILPKLIINGFHLTEQSTGNQHFIASEVIDQIGLDFECSFDFWYWGFKRIGKVVPVKSDVIYHLGDKPHIYHAGEFIATTQRRSD